MEFKIVWSDADIADLHGICAFIAERKPPAARQTGRGILDHVGILASFPFIGPAYPRGSRGPLREIVFRPDRIFYDVSEKTKSVEIFYVWHGARQQLEF